MKNMLLVFLGGGIGSVLRYIFYIIIPAAPERFPVPTFAVNLIGSFLIGLLMAYYSAEHSLRSPILLFLITGFCGGFTTFSTFSKESLNLMQNQQWGTAILYISLSLFLCIGGTAVGYFAIK